MDVGRVTEQERPALPEVVRDAVVHPVGREPVHLGHGDLHAVDGHMGDILEGEGLRMLGALVIDHAHEPHVALGLQREHREEVGLVEVEVEVAVHRFARGLHVGHVEQLAVGSARKAGVEGLAHPGSGAVAAGDEAGSAHAWRVRPRAGPRARPGGR